MKIASYMKKKREEYNCSRVFAFMIYVALYLILLLIFILTKSCQHKGHLVDDVILFFMSNGLLLKLVWCLSNTILGLIAVASKYLKIKHPPYLGYYLIYPVLILAISCLGLSVSLMLTKDAGYLFYFFSAGVCIILGYYIDSLKDLLKFKP